MFWVDSSKTRFDKNVNWLIITELMNFSISNCKLAKTTAYKTTRMKNTTRKYIEMMVERAEKNLQ